MGEPGLSDRIRAGRAREKRKKPLRNTLFDRVNGLVRAHGLGEAFLSELSGAAMERPSDGERPARVKRKERYALPLFSLSTEEEYRVTMAILGKVDIPYLGFVTAPEEILVCGRLHALNPHLGSEVLARHHFETLLLAETAKREIPELAETIRVLLEEDAPGEEDGVRLSLLEERLGALRGVVAGAGREGPERE